MVPHGGKMRMQLSCTRSRRGGREVVSTFGQMDNFGIRWDASGHGWLDPLLVSWRWICGQEAGEELCFPREPWASPAAAVRCCVAVSFVCLPLSSWVCK